MAGQLLVHLFEKEQIFGQPLYRACHNKWQLSTVLTQEMYEMSNGCALPIIVSLSVLPIVSFHGYHMSTNEDLNLQSAGTLIRTNGMATFFVQKKFEQAKANFKEVRTIENEYYFPTNYYYYQCYY